jgi:hypothetical protein
VIKVIRETIIKSGKIEPVPKLGDELKMNERRWKITACDCNKGKGDPRCGPHFIETNTYQNCSVYWHLDKGWSKLVDGAILIHNGQDQQAIIYNLKEANTSPLATNCASCGSKLKDPGMGPLYKHCPKCEP